MVTRSELSSAGSLRAFFDDATGERLEMFQPFVLWEDFAGPVVALPTSANAGQQWIKKLVQSGGTPTAARVASQAGGIIRLALDATSEKQEASVYQADDLGWDATKGLIWEARVNLHVLPSAAAVEMVWGLQSAWIDGPDNASYYMQFQALASGAVNLRTKDGVNTISKASGTTKTADSWSVYRIDATDVTDVKFFIDGARVSTTSALSFAATGANALLQPYFSVYKASGTGVGSMDVDAVKIGNGR